MNQLIDIAGISTLGVIGATAATVAAAINPIGAGLLIAGAYLWAKRK